MQERETLLFFADVKRSSEELVVVFSVNIFSSCS